MKTIMRYFAVLVSILILISPLSSLRGADFEELDKIPEGAHKGQMLLGAFVCIGVPRGDVIKAEEHFVKDSTYPFDNETTKLVEVSHLSMGGGLRFEYMPLNHLGLQLNARRSFIMQRSSFGKDYQNWRGALYKDYSLYLGPSLHATVRKQWDFTLTPLLGYAFYSFHATPVYARMNTDYSGSMSRKGSGITYGTEINCTLYFSGGLFVSLGVEWMRNPVKFSEPFDLTNPQTNKKYFEGKTAGSIDSYNFVLSSGYAFSN